MSQIFRKTMEYLFRYLLLILLVTSSSSIAFAQDTEDDVWGVEPIEGAGVFASINGRITYGDKYRIRIVGDECQNGELLFTFHTMLSNKDILKLEDKAVQIEYNNDVTDIQIIYSREFLLGHSVMFRLGIIPLDSFVSFHKDLKSISVELIDGGNFKASDYFDVLKNEWSLKGLDSSLVKAQELCLSRLATVQGDSEAK